ncbi:MAG: nitroreductase family protein [Gammaproteobacteria bacterium]
MFEKKAQTRVPINELLAGRWSGRAYDPSRPVSREQLITLIEAARWAPSCYGDEPWRYIVCDKSTDQTAWDKLFGCLMPLNQSWVKNVPLLILSAADSKMRKDGKLNRWGEHDTGAASMSICIQATELGLMAHQMGGFNVDKARESFAIPGQYVPMAVIAIGYQLPRENIPEVLKEKEMAGRVRRDLTSNFFAGAWGNPVIT